MPASPASPVFVDDSGRRHRIVRASGWVLAVVVVLYLGLLGVSLVGNPDVVPLSLPAIGHLLPGPGAPLIDTPRHDHGTSGDVLATVPQQRAGTAPPAPTTATARTTTASTSVAPALSPTPVAATQPLHGKSATAPSRTPTTTTSPATSTQPRSAQTPPASSKASTHSAHWRAATTAPSPAPTP
ncbi:MAG TPA: hypothetical protein VFJ21_14885 [Mycobacteriales bacterium]|jgi:hypothetical protein|nr:hypothetical protein [Mycobacteriales bacterium]